MICPITPPFFVSRPGDASFGCSLFAMPPRFSSKEPLMLCCNICVYSPFNFSIPRLRVLYPSICGFCTLSIFFFWSLSQTNLVGVVPSFLPQLILWWFQDSPFPVIPFKLPSVFLRATRFFFFATSLRPDGLYPPIPPGPLHLLLCLFFRLFRSSWSPRLLMVKPRPPPSPPVPSDFGGDIFTKSRPSPNITIAKFWSDLLQILLGSFPPSPLNRVVQMLANLLFYCLLVSSIFSFCTV